MGRPTAPHDENINSRTDGMSQDLGPRIADCWGMRRWLNQEISWAISGPRHLGPGSELYRARSEQQNYRLAQALVETSNESLDPFEQVKVYLSRGLLDKARELLATIPTDNTLDQQELRHEQARLAVYDGDWMRAKALLDTIITTGGIGLTVQSAYQIRSNVLVELGFLDEALEDLEKVDVISAMYPHAFSNFHAKCQKVRALYLKGNHASSVALSSQLWEECLADSPANYDRLLSLARLELLSRPPSSFSVSELSFWLRFQFLLSAELGDELYQNLALCYADNLGLQLKPEVHRTPFRRLAVLADPTFTEGRQLRDLIHMTKAAEVLIAARTESKRDLHRLTGVYFAQSTKFLRIDDRSLSPLSQRQGQLLEVCGNNHSLEVPTVFEKMTGVPFSRRVHGNYISNVVYQLKQKIGPCAAIDNGVLKLDGIMVINR